MSPRPHSKGLARLACVAVLMVHGIGCDDTTTSPPPPGRVEAVTARDEPAAADELCEVSRGPGQGPAFSLPALDSEPPAAPDRWRWVNVWATWCRPCVEELPMIQRWQERLGRDGIELDFVLVSADSDAEAVSRFRSEHAGMPPSLRAADPTALPGWVASTGLDEGAPLPIHVFVEPGGHVRCARAGALHEDDFASIERLVRGPG